MYIVNQSSSTSLLSSLLSKPPPPPPVSPPSNHLSVPIDPDLLTLLNSHTSSPKIIDRNSSMRSRDLEWKLVRTNESCKSILSHDSHSVCLHAQCSSCFATEGVRADTPIRPNCTTTFEWHVSSHTTSGTSVMFGVCTGSARLHSSNGYIDLLGGDSSSLALSSRGRLHYNGYSQPYCESFDDGREHIVKCVVSMGSRSYIQFYVDGRPMGARQSLDGIVNERVYACVASTTSRSIFRLARVYETYSSLKEMCVERIQSDASGRLLWTGLNEYRLPKSLFNEAF